MGDGAQPDYGVGIDAADFDHAFGNAILGVPALFSLTKRPKNQTGPQGTTLRSGLVVFLPPDDMGFDHSELRH